MISPGLTQPVRLCRFLKAAAKEDPPVFICHFYNFYFAHTAGGRMIGTKISSMILDNAKLQFYQYEGDYKPYLENVRDSINIVADSWTREQKDHCLEETKNSFSVSSLRPLYSSRPLITMRHGMSTCKIFRTSKWSYLLARVAHVLPRTLGALAWFMAIRLLWSSVTEISYIHLPPQRLSPFPACPLWACCALYVRVFGGEGGGGGGFSS